jgi:hypothetical protein
MTPDRAFYVERKNLRDILYSHLLPSSDLLLQKKRINYRLKMLELYLVAHCFPRQKYPEDVLVTFRTQFSQPELTSLSNAKAVRSGRIMYM